MKINLTAKTLLSSFVISFFYVSSLAQLTPRDFTLLSGPNSPGTTLIGSSITINGGKVGAYKLVQTTGNSTINADIISGDKVILTNSNIVNGKISAAANYPNSPISTGTILSVGSSASISGNIDVNGNIVIGGGTVLGTVTLPVGRSYSGPVPSGDTVFGPPNLPTLPIMPLPFNINSIYPVVNPATYTGNFTEGPGNYGNINFSGNKTMKLVKPGIYVFNSIIMTGNSNKLIFDFDNTPGNYLIYVRNNADFGKLNASTIGGNPSRIYLETQGPGTGTSISGYSFIIANGSSGGGSKWLGTVYATNGGINIGSGTGSSTLTGTFASNKAITLQSGVTVVYAPFTDCTPPDVKAGIPDAITGTFIDEDTTILRFIGQTTLTATSSTSGAAFNWQALKGGTITSNTNASTITVSAAGTYVVTAFTTNPNCISTDTITVLARVRNIIGAELLSIYQNYDPNNANAELDSFFVTDNGYVTIDIICKIDTQTVINLLTGNTVLYGLINVLPNGLSKHTVTGDFPVSHLLNLNSLGDILNFCKPYYRPSTNGGLVISQGDTTMRSYLVRKGYNVDGTGVKIGVISDSYNTITDPSKIFSDPCAGINQTLNVNTAAVDITEGDLANVTVLQDFPLKRTDEGRAMMQIVQDVAPGAQKYFQTGFFTAGHLAQRIEDLASLGCKSIVDDVTYVDQPMLKDGVVAKSVNKVKTQGVFYSTSAGNFAGRSYEKNFNPVDASSIGFPGKMAHNFGNDNLHPDFFQKVMLRPGSCFFVFQWLDNNFSQDELAGTQFDVDIFLTPADKTDGTGLIGFNRDNLFGDAVEFIPIQIPGNDPCDTVAKAYNILIVNNTTTGNPLRIKYVAFKGGFRIAEYNEGNSTIVGHANAEGAFTVGAARFNHVPGHPLLPSSLAGITKPQIESFSSVGGTMGRQKPDIVGPDGVDVTVLMGQDYPNQALNNFSNFFGTSAAAPHIAAAAALIIQARDKFLKQSTSPDQLKSLFQSTAVDMRPPGLVGYDFLSGPGLIDVDAAMRTFATPTPFEISLVKPTNIIPCQDPFELTIKGENFSDNTKIYLVNAPGDSTILTPSYISETKDTVKVIINICAGNPEILAYTPPTLRVPPVVDGAIDGGFSNSIKLFDKEIVIQTQNVSKKYGQANPLPTTIITVNGVPIEQTSLTRASVGLDETKLNLIETNATTYSSVGTYAIKVYRTFNNSNPTDLALTNQYSYVFKSGLITIDKLPLTVTPNNITANVGDHIGNVTYSYEFDPQYPLLNAAAVADTAKKYHEAFLPKNALAVIKDFKKQQANGSVLSDADLTNMNTMVSFNALANSRKFKIENNKLVPETNPNNLNSQYIVDLASESIYDFRQNPALAKYYSTNTGVTKKTLLGEVSLDNYLGKVEVTNGAGTSLQTLINGNRSPVLNAIGISSLAPIVNGNLVTILDGQLATLNSGVLQPIPNSPKIQYLNATGIGSLIYLVNGQVVTLGIGSLATLVNGQTLPITEANSYVVIPNVTAALHLINGANSLQYLINGTQYPVINVSNVTANASGALINALTLQPLINGSLIALNGKLGLATLVNGVTGISQLSPLVNGAGISSLQSLVNNVGITVTNGVTSLQPLVNNGSGGGGTSLNKTAVIFDETDVNAITNNYLGALFGINMITGLDAGVQRLVPAKLPNSNFEITYIPGKVTIIDSSCLLTRNAFNNFGSTPSPQKPTTLWVNVETKVSGQLKTHGRYLLYTAGSITLNDIVATDPVTNTLITTKDLPDGMIIADQSVTAPTTHYDGAKKMWITRVPVGFSSTSDLFISGGVINSKDGFVKKKNNANSSTILRGIFYCDTVFSDQWTYALATYRTPVPYAFDIPSVSGEGQIVAINGAVASYRAGTPLPHLPYLVNGASGGGGNNYTGSTSSFDNFTACCPGCTPVENLLTSSTSLGQENSLPIEQENLSKGEFRIMPNPASDFISLSFVPTLAGNSRIVLYTVDGRKVFEKNNGVVEAGLKYMEKIDVSKFVNGVYLVQLWNADKVTNKKIVISR